MYTLLLMKQFQGRQIKGSWTPEACGTHRTDPKWIRDFVRKPLKR